MAARSEKKLSRLCDSTADDYDLWIENINESTDGYSQPAAGIPEHSYCQLISTGCRFAERFGSARGQISAGDLLKHGGLTGLTIGIYSRLHYGPATDKTLKASAVSAFTDRAAWVNHDVAELRAEAVIPSVNLTAKQKPSPNTGAKGQEDAVRFTLSNPHAAFGVRKGVHVVIKKHFGLCRGCQDTRQRDILPVRKVGGRPLTMATSEIYTALERGTLDGAELATPADDYRTGVQEITKYNAVPGWHQPMCACGWAINLKAWNALDDDLKELFEVVGRQTYWWSWAMVEVANVEAMKKFAETDIEITTYSKKDLDTLRSGVYEYVEQLAEKDEMAKRMAQSYWGFFEWYKERRQAMGPFGWGYTPDNLPKVFD